MDAIRADQLDALDDFESSPAFTDLERAVIRFAIAMSATPARVSDAVFAPLRRELTDAQVVELTSAVAWEHYRARFNRALGIESENFSEGATCVLPAFVQSAEDGSRRGV